MDQQTGKYIIAGGIFIVIAGLLIYFFHDHLKWLGKLPGDIRIEKDNFRFYFPVVTMIILSVIITIVINIFKRFL
jgi:H+/Cl- antiporter ClcA